MNTSYNDGRAGELPTNAYIRKLPPYIPGKPIAEVAREFGLENERIVKLASNENPLGMAPSARIALANALGEASRYPDANGFDLKCALAERYHVPEAWLTLGNGSNDILELVAKVFLSGGKSAVFSQYAFIVYSLATQAAGADAIVVPATETFGHDLPAMLSAILPNTAVVFIANPNNPTGTFVPWSELEDFLLAVPPQVIVVIDEAYNEYLVPSHRFDSSLWVKRFPNVIVSRTFSKAYGLAGLRVGYALARDPVSDLLGRVRQPFNVGALAQATALAALADVDFISRTYEVNRAGYLQLTDAFEELNLPYVPSHGNFVLCKVGNDAVGGNYINLELLKLGVIVRPVINYGLPQWLRISIGLPEENHVLIEALRKILKQAPAAA